MRIGVDARVLEASRPTGVERAAEEMLRALPGALSATDEVVAFSRVPLSDRPEGTSAAGVLGVALGGPRSPSVWRETKLCAALTVHRIDVLWSPVTALPLTTAVPRVATFHEAPWLVRRGIEGRLRESAHAIALRIAVASATAIVCPSRASAAQIEALHPGTAARVRVVPHGVSARFLAARDAASNLDGERRRERLGVVAPYFLQVGGVRPRKNVPLLLRAFAEYQRLAGRASLVIAGPGELPGACPGGVALSGFVDDQDLLALYDGATALVVASEAEGFGIPVLEAMARGTPVVALPSGGVTESAAGAALLVEPQDGDFVGTLAATMLRVEGDQTLRDDLAARGRLRVKTARWADSARALADVLRDAVSEGHGRR